MGTPDFAVPALKAIAQSPHQLIAVYTQPDKPAGRGRVLTSPPVKVVARELKVPVLQPHTLRDRAVQLELAAMNPEVIVVAAYAQLLPQAVLSIPQYGCKNIHASLLPRYRGGAPIHWAIVNGERETGITIMQMNKGLDTGDMITTRAVTIGEDETCDELARRLALLGAVMICDVLSLPDLGESLRVPQDHSQSTFARNVRKEDGLLDWGRSNRDLHNRIRGFNPWPGAYSHLNGQPLKIVSSTVSEIRPGLEPGEIVIENGRFIVGCGGGSLELLLVQPSGKRIMTALDFSRGYYRGTGSLRFD